MTPRFRPEALWTATILCGLLVGAIARLPPVHSVNDASRWNTVWSLTHGKGYVIDPGPEDPVWEVRRQRGLDDAIPEVGAPYPTIDRIYLGSHFYSSKPPLLPTALAGLAWTIRAATGLDIPEHDGIVLRLILILINVLPLGAMVLFYDRLMGHGGFGAETRNYCLMAAAFGTYLTGYSVSLNNHTLAAVAVFFALYNALAIADGRGREPWRFALCGLCAAWAVANELPALLFALGLLAWMLRARPGPTLRWALAPGLVLAGAFLLTTWWAKGSLVPAYLSGEGYAFIGSQLFGEGRVGLDRIYEKWSIYVAHFLVGHHGFFSLTPVLAIALVGMVPWGREGKGDGGAEGRGGDGAAAPGVAWRWAALGGLALTVATLAAYVYRTRNYGGECQGPRWLFWLIPFWLLGLARAVERLRERRWFPWVAAACLFVSVLSVGFAITGGFEFGSRGPWGESWLHRLMRGAGLVRY